ncbi:ABC transporter permease [Mesorhizobium sp. B2-4-2]|uniref:ABC transporter permease n=1 Tax=unclassified Mesorhizobium TaxID=325217 RepID=UPI001127737D|nr:MULTISPECIES: ABC transporter permease [unclassified Mesorhizobium]MBZ9920450.1 ABC transporter permease [Mesorhizobium sp. BR1-1-7]MBZ9956491.1 ABC transporter permease [Mesorhizobium sp. BR1-1-15]MBZ9961906.1 ABC transporter permease [Mesorhizobium sp. BR1-1-14]MBZ9973709.1 ABC transporter permease [Mesorhizobium sp. BR1-1-12]TPL42335.1 ABC transporter permease [Mesorhizobium sp. B2-4-4]
MSEQAIVETTASQPAKSRSLGASIFLNAARTAEFRVGAVIFLGLLLLSVVAPTLLGLSATKFSVGLKFSPPFPEQGWVWPHMFGTDQLGRDLLARSLIGLRNALMIGIASVIGMFVIGSAIGMLAGYAGGWTSLILMRITDAQMSIPVIILAITILGVTRPTPMSVILVFILAGWPGYARIARSVTMSERRKEYVRAAKILGASDLRILLVHIAPNTLPPIAFVAVLDVARMMIFEAILGFIGIGIQPPTPTFGTIIADGTKYLMNAWWITTIPGLLLAASLCGINLMGGALERSRNKFLQGVL